MGGYIHIPWVLIGDFNQIVKARDKQGGRAFNPATRASLIETIEFCQLMDVGFHGTHYTWTNNWKESVKIRNKESIERGVMLNGVFALREPWFVIYRE